MLTVFAHNAMPVGVPAQQLNAAPYREGYPYQTKPGTLILASSLGPLRALRVPDRGDGTKDGLFRSELRDRG
jgi:hypothetical protein